MLSKLVYTIAVLGCNIIQIQGAPRQKDCTEAVIAVLSGRNDVDVDDCDDFDNGKSTIAIVGIAFGGVLGVVALLVITCYLCACCCKRRKRKKDGGREQLLPPAIHVSRASDVPVPPGYLNYKSTENSGPQNYGSENSSQPYFDNASNSDPGLGSPNLEPGFPGYQNPPPPPPYSKVDPNSCGSQIPTAPPVETLSNAEPDN